MMIAGIFTSKNKRSFRKNSADFGLNYLRRLYAFANVERDRLNEKEKGMSKKAEEIYRKTTEVIVAFREAISALIHASMLSNLANGERTRHFV